MAKSMAEAENDAIEGGEPIKDAQSTMPSRTRWHKRSNSGEKQPQGEQRG